MPLGSGGASEGEDPELSAHGHTDGHWQQRALEVTDDAEVNIADVFQRELEYDAFEPWLQPGWRLLEVGCGNGYSTRRFRKRVAQVDALDSSPAMIERAKQRVGEQNNRFVCDDLLKPQSLEPTYDAIVCVRVLINLSGLEQQLKALESMRDMLGPGGVLILVEGFLDGFGALSELRSAIGLSPVEPAAINYYSALGDLLPAIEEHFERLDSFHLGAYDYLTRVMYPLLAEDGNVSHNAEVSRRAVALARAFNPPDLEHFSRVRGFLLRKRWP